MIFSRLLWSTVAFGSCLALIAVTSFNAIALLVPRDGVATLQNRAESASKTVESLGNATRKPRFTQFWSSGHVGTKFLTTLFAHPSMVTRQEDLDYFVWMEHELSLGNLSPDVNQTLSSRDFQALLLGSQYLPKSIDDTIVNRNPLRAKSFQSSLSWFGGQQVKKWNSKGERSALSEYVEQQRVPALEAVHEAFPSVQHWIKFGHTAIFFPLPEYYHALSKRFDVTFVRIQRRRTQIAKSFSLDLGGHRPGPCHYQLASNGIVTCPYYGTALLKFPFMVNDTGKELWQSWSVFQQHLWLVDEIEARWQAFRTSVSSSKTQPRIHTTVFDEEDHLSPDSLDELANFLNVPSPRKYLQSTPIVSHKSQAQKEREQRERDLFHQEAIAYSQTAPWCKQNSIRHPISIDCDPSMQL